MDGTKHVLVVSGIKLREGGALSVLVDCLRELEAQARSDWIVYAVVGDRRLLPCDFTYVRLIEYPGVRGGYLGRMWVEYVQFADLARKLGADLWLSLHDVTPRVPCLQYTYCHNPSPFYPFRLRDLWMDPTFAFFTLCYGWVYRINVRRNAAVIVQQEWMAREFERRYKPQRVWVARPVQREAVKEAVMSPQPQGVPRKQGGKVCLFYPAFPRVFKNHEVILRALRHLSEAERGRMEIVFTIQGGENSYARFITNKAKDLAPIRLIGRISRNEVHAWYAACDAMIFPSKLETWGLPISEFGAYAKPILAADMSHTREAAAGLSDVHYFAADDDHALAVLMRGLLQGGLARTEPPKPVSADVLPDWKALIDRILIES